MPQPAANVTANDRTIRAGLVGRGITLSRTPAMHEAEGKALGLNYHYALFDLDDPDLTGRTLSGIIEIAEAEGFAGLNVTHPFKIDAIQHLHSLSENARAVGAVNSIVLREGRRTGHNTDLWGFAESFHQGMKGAPLDEVLLLGAGGAGVAVGHALLSLGAQRLWIFDTDFARAEELIAGLAARFGVGRSAMAESPHEVGQRISGLVNATPVGMAKLPGSPFPAMLLRPHLWVADIVYFPLETELLAAARAAGCRVLPGIGMAVFQAVRAFELFTGRQADPSRMRQTFEALGP